MKNKLLLAVLIFVFTCTVNVSAFDRLGLWPAGPCQTVAINEQYAFMGSGGFLGIADLDSYTMISLTQMCGQIMHMYARDNFLYLSALNDGLLIVDVSDPGDPVIVSVIDQYTMSSVIDGDRLYLSASTYGLFVYDISDPENPVFLGSGNEWGYTRETAIYGNYGYVAQSSIGLKVIDVTDPAAMSQLGEVSFTNNTAVVVAVHQGYLYVGSLGEDGFEIFDLTGPANPQSVKYVDVGSSYKFQFRENYMFLAAVGDRLKIYDITNPAEIAELMTFEGGIPYDIAVNATHICMADQDEGMLIYPIADDYMPSMSNSFDLDFSALSFWANGSYLYFPVYNKGLRILDVSDPLNIIDHDYYDLNAKDVAFGDGLMYMSHGDEIDIVDNTNPAQPEKITGIEVGGNHFGLLLNYPYLYAFPHQTNPYDFELKLLDITQPESPELLSSTLHNTFFRQAEFYQNHLYLLDNEKYLYQLDVTDPHTLVMPAGPAFSDTFNGFWMLDQYAYLTNGKDELLIYDFSDPAHLELVNTISNIDLYSKPLFIGNLGYSPGFMGKNIVDFSNPVHPAINGFLSLPGYVGSTTIANGRLYVQKIIMENKIDIYDLSQPLNPGKLGSIPSFGQNYGLTVQDGIVYAATGSGGLRIFDFDSGENSLSSQLGTQGKVVNVIVNNEKAYLAESNHGLRIVDVQEHAQPVTIGNYSPSTNSTIKGLVVHNDIAYLLGGVYNDIIDVSDTSNPEYLGDLPLGGTCNAGVIVNDIMYAADSRNGLQIVDVSDPEQTTILNTIDTPGYAYDVAYHENYLYLADGNTHLRIYDLTDPQSPEEIGSFDILYSFVRAVDIYDHYAVLACDYRGIYFIDISDPLNPVEAGSIYIYNHEFNDVVVENGYVYATAAMNGVFKFGHELITQITDQKSIPLDYSLAQNYPNPFNPITTISYTLPKTERVRIDILNINGQLVKTLTDMKQGSGTHLLLWDGTTNSGSQVASGVYFYRIEAGVFKQTKKMVLVR